LHLLQSLPWSAFKADFGWQPRTISLTGSPIPVQILYRRLPLGFKLAYLPKGPTLDWQNTETVRTALADLTRLAQEPTTIFLKVEPDLADDPQIAAQFIDAGFWPVRPVQPQTTIIIDLAGSEEAILAAMKSKTRYNIRLAERKGITVRQGTAADLDCFYQLSLVTAERDGFAIHSADYYAAAFAAFPTDCRALLLAEFEGQPLAGLMIFRWQDRAYYLYGASTNEHREKMPTYLLQWEAMCWAKSHGCRSYDLYGIPDAPLETLETEFLNRHDGLWGVYRFKRGFGGEVVRSMGAFDFVYKPQLYKWLLYTTLTRLIDRRSAQNAGA
jgi:lipid II:glycine glycyltransferase (peptidoglycan interpeptide bridge formation enzyme)